MRIEVPPQFVRNHPSQTAIMPPDDAAEYLLSQVQERTGKKLAHSRILDVGCGTRFEVAINNKNLQVGEYVGIDIVKPMMTWLTQNVSHPKCQFHFWSVRNPEYSPTGLSMAEFQRFPAEGQFDIIIFFSVFTHLGPDDAKEMLRLSKTSLKPDGKLFLTVFVDRLTQDYKDEFAARPSLMSKYNANYFEMLVAESGFEVESVAPPAKLMASSYVLSPRAA